MPNQSPRIAVLGSINMDLVVRCPRLPRPGETILADESSEVPGGKGANQAVAAARLGAAVTLIGRVGSDTFAKRLLDNLRAENVDTSCVRRTDSCSSGLAIVSVEHTGENAIIVVPGANALVTHADVDAAADIIRKADVLLLQLEIPIDTVMYASQMARDAGTCVILDPAPAPVHVPQELLAVDIVCPNQSEAAAILGITHVTADDALPAAQALVERGAASAIITQGRHGAVICSRDGTREHVTSIEVRAVDTTAAGDAFAAALGVRIAEGCPLAEAVRFACVAGAIAASRPGAQPSMPTREDVVVHCART